MAVRSKKEVKSTIISMRDEFDWGRIFYDACYVFNYNLANYFIVYANNYDNGKKFIDDAEDKIIQYSQKREEIIKNRKELKENRLYYSGNATENYFNYMKALPIGRSVSGFRKYNRAKMNNDIDGMNKYSKYAINYLEAIEESKKFNIKYNDFIRDEIKAINNERMYIDSNLYKSRNYGTKLKTLNKLIDMHKYELMHPMIQDKNIIYDFLTSPEQAEKLMAMCINILNNYSNKEFSSLMSLQDREHVADIIYKYFSTFQHNYDFIVGCYELKDNKLVLKDIETLKNKFYNGYFFTLKGFLKRSYIEARYEHFNVESSDSHWEDDEGNGNHGVDIYSNTEEKTAIAVGLKTRNFDEGMVDFWNRCKDFLNDNVTNMSNEYINQMRDILPKAKYYKTDTNFDFIINKTIEGINFELSNGRQVGTKLKYIILDAMGGAENKDEWKTNINIISKVMMKYINKFFTKNTKELIENYQEQNVN